jgi:hypothetical protein
MFPNCADDPDAIAAAYVTPLLEIRREQCKDGDWRRVRSAVLSVYGATPPVSACSRQPPIKGNTHERPDRSHSP